MISQKSIENIESTIQLSFREPEKIDGCIICSLVMDYEFNLISKLQFNISTDKIIREEVAAEGGFCDFHFRQFKKIANGKTNILLLKSIIESGSFRNKNFLANCRICSDINQYEQKVVEIFPFLFNNQNFRKSFENSIGICFDHLKMVTNIIENKNISDWLFNTHMNQIGRLQKDFDDMNKIKSFYEIDRNKRKLINILIEKLAGRKTRSL